MKHLLFTLSAIALLTITACDSKKKPMAIGQDCLIGYATTLSITAESEKAACTAVMDAIDKKTKAFDDLNTKVWDTARSDEKSDVAEGCDHENADLRVRFLDEDMQLRVHCAMSCSGSKDPDNLNCDK